LSLDGRDEEGKPEKEIHLMNLDDSQKANAIKGR
jgi:hypothetical protein